MSTIESLSIQGIRSYGTKKDDRQIISFSSPLTLILGENGCGKTTVIECLKYALTGEVPPGTNRGQSFVHDPKIFQNSESLGQVKLMVRNIRGEKLTVTRSMKLSHKRGKMAFETMDSTVNYEVQGQKDSISKRCIDVDVEMCQFMGVSKAIINNVIFCHQEDACWPLDEAKKLKEKFDAIFGTTEYNKAIDKIIKLRKEQMDQLKINELNLKHLGEMKREMENRTLDLQNAIKKLEDIKSRCSGFEEEVKPIEARIVAINTMELEISKLQARKIELSTKLKNCSEQINSLQSKIKKPFAGSIPQLDREISSFYEKMEEKKCELQTLEDRLQRIKLDEKRIASALADIDRKKAGLIHQRQQEQEYLDERAKKIGDLCAKLKIIVSCNLEENGEAVKAVLGKIAAAIKVEDKKLVDMSASHDKQDQEMQADIDKLRVQKTKIDSDISSKSDQKTQTERENRKLEEEIKSIEASAETLNTITREIERVTKVYEDSQQAVDLDKFKQNIADKRKNISKLEETFSKLDEQLTFLNSIGKLMAEITLKRKEVEKKEQEIKRVKGKHGDHLKTVFPNRTIESNYRRNIQTAYTDVQQTIKETNNKINSFKLKEKELEIKRKNCKDDIAKWERQLDEGKSKIFDKCHATPYEDLVARCKENIAKFQLDHGALKSSEAMYKKYMKKIEEDPCCPLCHKNMSGNEAADLSSELTDEIERLPQNIQRTESQLKKEQTKLEGLHGLMPIIEQVKVLEKDIPEKKKLLNKTEEQLGEISTELESQQMLLAEPTSNLTIINSMMGDMSLLDEAMKDVARLQAELLKLESKIPKDRDTSASVDDVQLEKATVAGELKTGRAECEALQSKYEKSAETLNKLREKKNSLKDKRIKLQENVQALPQLKERREENETKLKDLVKDISALRDQIGPLKDMLSNKIEEKQILKSTNRELVNELTTKLDTLKIVDHDIQRYTRELKTLGDLNLVEQIEIVKTTMKRHLNDQTVKAKENSEVSEKIEQHKIEVRNQETLERDLKDNRELKLLEKQQKDLQDQEKDLSQDIGDMDFRKISREKAELIQRRDSVAVKKGELLGQMGEINNQVKKLDAELKEPRYRDSMKNYRKTYYEVQVLKKVIADLGQYRLALEWALLEFHTEKMEEINRLIRELWRQVYRGNDIDYIQIQTDEMKTESTDRRRSYNYRLVQSKNNSEIDMRGRCSAGQRVLACLIIRMALAETFSGSCGVLALDEPTTNLDRDNILSLCEALNRIVEERQSQSNFLFVIITHDEQFISTLAKVNSYFRVFRDDEGKSVIRKVKVA